MEAVKRYAIREKHLIDILLLIPTSCVCDAVGLLYNRDNVRVTMPHALAFVLNRRSEIIYIVCSLKFLKIERKHETMCNSYYGAAPIISTGSHRHLHSSIQKLQPIPQ